MLALGLLPGWGIGFWHWPFLWALARYVGRGRPDRSFGVVAVGAALTLVSLGCAGLYGLQLLQ
jgi:hypothetical protein